MCCFFKLLNAKKKIRLYFLSIIFYINYGITLMEVLELVMNGSCCVFAFLQMTWHMLALLVFVSMDFAIKILMRRFFLNPLPIAIGSAQINTDCFPLEN